MSYICLHRRCPSRRFQVFFKRYQTHVLVVVIFTIACQCGGSGVDVANEGDNRMVKDDGSGFSVNINGVVGGVNDQAPERSKTVVVDSDSGTFCGGGSGSGAGGFVDSPLCRPDDSIDASSSFQNNSTFPFSSDSTIIPSSHSHMSANSMPPQTPHQHSHINDMPPQAPLLHAPDQFGSHTMEAFLRPQLPRDVSVNTALTSTDFSEESSSLMTDDGNGKHWVLY